MSEDVMAQLRARIERLREINAAKENFVPSPEQVEALVKIKAHFPNAVPLPMLDEEKIFTVGIDESKELESLREQARSLQDLTFDEKLKAVNDLVVRALPKNSVEEADKGDAHAFATVHNEHPLSRALKSGSGCCRYQGALFFLLAKEANLGESHFIFTQAKGPGFFTVYNVVNEKGTRHLVSIYNQTLSPDAKEKHGYPEPVDTEPKDFSSQQAYYGYVATKGEPLLFKTVIRTADEQAQWGKPILP